MTSPTHHSSLEVGAVIGGAYELVREIGRGGMGVVFEAQHLRLPKRVAVKVLDAAIAAVDHDALARFRREAEIASRLGHPHIVSVSDFGESARGPAYIVLELIDGVSLASLLDDGPLERPRALAIARQVGSALAAAHEAGVVHRDLKPANIMIEAPGTEAERAVVLDFGISKILGSHTVRTETRTVLGTPGYMAPEQARGDLESVGPVSDVFALAAIVYEMLEGRPAFGGQTAVEIAYKLVHGARPTLSGSAPRSLAGALARAFDANPDRRTPTVEAFLEQLDGAPQDLDGDAATPRGRRAIWLAPAAAAALLVVALAAWRPWETRAPAATSAVARSAELDASTPADATAPLARAMDAGADPAIDASVASEVPARVRPPRAAERVTGQGSGAAAPAAGCDVDGRDGIYKRCLAFAGGRCQSYGVRCGSTGPRCLYDVSVQRYRHCARVVAGRCDRFVRDCMPAGPQPCVRTGSRGVYRRCTRVKGARCLEHGKTCKPAAF